MSNFRKENIISDDLYKQITDVRVNRPEKIKEIAQKRTVRNTIASSGKLNIVAADHPARGSVSVGDDLFAMADRHDLLARLVHVLKSEWIDGVLGSMDVLEELLIIQELTRKNGKGFLDNKVLLVSLNRAGHPGTAWELNDPITGTDAVTCREMKIDGAKMLFRVEPGSKDTLKTLLECVRGVKDMSSNRLPIFLEPLPVKKEDNGYNVIKDANLLTELVSITSALGNTSRYIWLKLPYTENFEKVAAATTCPIVILGGGKSSSLKELLDGLDAALKSGHQVRGAMFGRNLLYPDSVDPLALADAIGQLVHGQKQVEEIWNDLEPYQ